MSKKGITINSHVPTLDEWIASNALPLGLDIATHIKQYVPDKDDVEGLLRCIMTSIRQHEERKNK